jgi:beta-lactamase superfamily II metal-dependent hydrolase
MILRVFDVEHGACAMLTGPNNALAVIDCGTNSSTGWRPNTYIRQTLQRTQVEYLLITNVDQDHISDLANLLGGGINVQHILTNMLVSPEVLQILKQASGPLTADAQAYLRMRSGTTGHVGIPFNQGMGGVTVTSYCNSFPTCTNTNDLSAVYFISYGPFTAMFPGDIERAGWNALMRMPGFVTSLTNTTIYVASHHGRTSGFSDDAFQYLKPQAVVISDKSIIHDTQDVDYRSVVRNEGVQVKKPSGEIERRHVLTTRRDGDIIFSVQSDGQYTISKTVG